MRSTNTLMPASASGVTAAVRIPFADGPVDLERCPAASSRDLGWTCSSAQTTDSSWTCA
ncbi:MAG: hypothetical protein ACRDYA_08990 [Egibacteraceae bacterium]